MKKHIQNIELINQYFNNELSSGEQGTFSNRLKIDNEFKILFDEQSQFIEGIKRYVLKDEIKKACRTYKRNKLLKFLGIAILTIVLVITIFSIINKSTGIITIDNPAKEIFSARSSNTVKNFTITKATIKPVNPIVKTIVKTIEPNINVPKQMSNSAVIISADDQKNTTKIKQLYSSFKKQPEVFQINTEKDTVITCKEGTLLKIKAHSFVDSKKNQIIKGKFQLNVTEYYNLSDIICANLTTLADEAILETGGMLYMEAYQNTEICQLSSKKTLAIGFPYEQHKKDMMLFSGEKKKKQVNWKLLNNKQMISKTINATLVSEAIVVDFLSDKFESGLNYPLKDSINNKNIEDKLKTIDTVVTNENPVAITKRDITRYLFSTSKLGWINCDRFISSKKTKIKFKVKVENGTDIDVKMIFKNFKAVLPGKFEKENYIFSKVPIDAPVIIYAIKYEDGQYYIALNNTHISNKNTPLTFEKVSLPRLKEKIKELKHL